MPLLLAASPVEIMARADDLGLPASARDAALALFHALTSAEELAAMDLPAGTPAGSPPGAHEGSRWPVHGFLFGREEEVAPVAASLRGRAGTAELGAGMRADTPPGTLFLCRRQDGFTGLLVACTDAATLAGAMPGTVPSAAAGA